MTAYRRHLFHSHIPALIQCCKETGAAYDELVSKTLNAILNDCGYSEERIKEHIQSFTKLQRASRIWGDKNQERNCGTKMYDSIMVGSQLEGAVLYNSSDVDSLLLYSSHRAYESLSQCKAEDEQILIVETSRVPPGYCFLRIYQPNQSCLDENASEVQYLSSEIVMKNFEDLAFNIKKSGRYISASPMPRQGPSAPMGFNYKENTSYYLDQVCTVLCHYPSLLHEWKNRRRPQNWPKQEVLDKVASLPVFAVPVPQKGSDFQFLQWRFCFNLGEIILTHSLNHTQMKVYILLKLIAKYILKPICDDITSFIMKNVVFWLAELKPVEEFTPNTLLDRLIDALTILKESLKSKQLNYYMIPERNLLAGKMTDSQNCRLLDCLTQLISNHGQDFLKLYIPGEDVEAVKQSLQLAETVFVDLFGGNVKARLDALNILPLTVQELAIQLENGAINHFEKNSTLGLHYVPFAIKNIFQALSTFGFRMFYDPLGVKHESVVDPTLDVDDYDMWICPTCRNIALRRPQTLTERNTPQEASTENKEESTN